MSFLPGTYEDWRKTVPFTDEQIAEQLERDAAAIESANSFLARRYRYRAAQVRKGYVSSKDVSQVIGALITVCAICGKKALYHSGNEGRCSTHRLVRSAACVARAQRGESAATKRARAKSEADRRLLGHESFRRTRAGGGTFT